MDVNSMGFMELPIAEKIKIIRKEKGITQKELAEKLNCTQANLSQYESGRRIPKKNTRARIAEALEVDPLLFSNTKTYNIHIDEKVDDKARKDISDYLLNTLLHTRNDYLSKDDIVFAYNEDEYNELLLKYTNQMNKEGKKKVLYYAIDLADNRKYRIDNLEDEE